MALEVARKFLRVGRLKILGMLSTRGRMSVSKEGGGGGCRHGGGQVGLLGGLVSQAHWMALLASCLLVFAFFQASSEIDRSIERRVSFEAHPCPQREYEYFRNVPMAFSAKYFYFLMSPQCNFSFDTESLADLLILYAFAISFIIISPLFSITPNINEDEVPPSKSWILTPCQQPPRHWQCCP